MIHLPHKERFQLIYSVTVVILVPAIIVINTLTLSSALRSDFDAELRRKADLANQIFATSLVDPLKNQDYDLIQQRISELEAARPDLTQMQVAVPDGQGFAVVGSSSDVTEPEFGLEASIAIQRQRAITQYIDIVDESGGKANAWYVVSPIFSGEQIIGVTSVALSTADAEELLSRTLLNAGIVLVISVVIVLLLLINHFKFVGYAHLLQKQKELNQTMTDFLSVATHELKAPMTVIRGSLSNVLDGLHGKVSKKMEPPLELAVSQTDRLNGLVQDLLNVSRIEQGRVRYDIESVSVDEVASIIYGMYKPLAKEKDIDLDYQISDKNIHVKADKGRLQEILTNLVDNAVKYTKKGDVRLGVEVDGDMALIRVKDSGIGMSSEERKRLFQRFYRVRNDDTQDISGTGLGLWIIKQYIEAMGGSIEVDSIKDTGTEFSVRLKLDH